jgi:hypothetical protein
MTVTAFDLCKVEGHLGPNANPRQQHLCQRCARPLASDEMPRDLDREQKWCAEAAEFAQYVNNPEAVAESLMMYRALRMGHGAWQNVSQRDWIREAEEECVDLTAYLTAELTRLGDDRTDEDADKCRMLLKMAMSSAITALAALGEYRTTDL